MSKIPVGVLGIGGRVGRQYAHLLQDHPFFELVSVAPIGNFAIPCKFLFSALPTSVAFEWEEQYARAGFGIISNASAHRSDPDVPLIIPEINPHHLEVLTLQRQRWDGFIVCKPNCSVQSYLLPLEPLRARFGVKKVAVTMLQALSGDGSSFSGNVIPYIAGEEEKSETEPLKIWGDITPTGIKPTDTTTISAHCNRVPVQDGHLACVSVSFESKPTLEEIKAAWNAFPSLHYCDEVDRPQPLLDCNAGDGMTVTIGRLRPCNLFDVRFVALSHNTVRGAAGGALATAELMLTQGYIPHAQTQPQFR